MSQRIDLSDYIRSDKGRRIIDWGRVDELLSTEPEKYKKVMEEFVSVDILTVNPHGSIGAYAGGFNVGPILVSDGEKACHNKSKSIIPLYFRRIIDAKQYKATKISQGINPELLSIDRKVID